MFASYFSKNRITILFLIILIVSGFLRFYKIDSKSLWLDEFHCIIPTDPSKSLASVVSYCKADQPPLFFVLLYEWYKVFPYNEASGRCLSAIIGIIGVIAMFFLGKEIKDKELGLASSFLTSINWFHIHFSQELRFYSLLFLLTVLSFIFLIRFIRNEYFKDYILFILSCTLLIYTHYYAMVVLLTQAIIYILVALFQRKRISFYIKGLGAALIVICLFIPWIPIVVADNKIQNFWIGPTSPFFFIQYFGFYFKGFFIIRIIFVGLILLFLWNFFILFRKKETAGNSFYNYLIMILWVLLTYLIPYIYSVVRIPMIVERYTIITLGGLILIVATGWMLISNRSWKSFIIVAIIAMTIPSFNTYYNKHKKQEFRQLSERIIKDNKNNYPVFSTWSWYFNYYFKKLKAQREVIKPDGENMKNPAINNFWLIETDELDAENRAYISSNFDVERELTFYGLTSRLYKRKI